MSRAIVTVGVSQSRKLEPYVARFRKTFAEYGCADEVIAWDKEWPSGALPHRECNYGFKVYAVTEAYRRGHREVLWLDASCYAIKPLEPLWQRIVRQGHVLVADVPNPLGKWSSDHSLAHFGISRDEAMEYPLMCGTCWGLYMYIGRSRRFFVRLRELAVPEHFNGTHISHLLGFLNINSAQQSNCWDNGTHVSSPSTHPRPGTDGARVSNDHRCWGHRSDEVYMSLLAREYEMSLNTVEDCEFVGGMPVTGIACVRSGYNL